MSAVTPRRPDSSEASDVDAADRADATDEGVVATAVALPVRRRGRVGRVLVVGLAGAGVAAWLLVASPFAAVTAVDIEGASPRWASQVRSAAEREVGVPLVRVDTARVAARLRGVPGVLRASVSRRWPHTLVVRVVERAPAAGVRVAGGVRVFDAAGVDLGVRPAPAGLPLLAVPATAVRPATVAAVVAVRDSLPAQLRGQLVELGAATPDGVWFVLRGGTRVVWGSAAGRRAQGGGARGDAPRRAGRGRPHRRRQRPGRSRRLLNGHVRFPDAPLGSRRFRRPGRHAARGR